jgi:demethylmenaquinone methyltransferase/2-methoxy-6-polyprenyl-1,4-benzoquinol methylase
VGLRDATAHTIVSDVQAPLSPPLDRAMEALFEMRWPRADQELEGQDRAEYRRLCLATSPDFILRHPDYYAFFTFSLFFGTVAA